MVRGSAEVQRSRAALTVTLLEGVTISTCQQQQG